MFTIIKHINVIFTWKIMIIQTILIQSLTIAIVCAAQKPSLDEFKFTLHTDAYKFIMSIFPFFILNFPASVVNIERYIGSPKAKVLKLIRELFQRLIVSFVLVYVLTIFSDNLLPSILGLSNTIVFTIYGVWCIVVFTYLLVLYYLIFVGAYDLIKSRDYPVEKIMYVKVLSGLMGNSLVMSPLIKKVGDEMRPEWRLMMIGMMLVMIMPVMGIIMVDVFLNVKKSTK